MVKASQNLLPRRVQEIDRHIGVRVRERRIMLGFTQQQLADMIGVTYQQAHKYEKGINRMAAGRLYKVARMLGVEVSYFFEGLQGGGTSRKRPQQRRLLELARNFKTSRSEHQQAICSLARMDLRPKAWKSPLPRRRSRWNWRSIPSFTSPKWFR